MKFRQVRCDAVNCELIEADVCNGEEGYDDQLLPMH